jgi:Xaa-Pro dipeptidase
MAPAFPVEEFLGRQQRFQEALRAADLPIAVVNTPENICYLTGHQTAGYYTYQCLVVPAVGDPVLMMRETEVVNGKDTTYLGNIVGFADIDDPLACTAAKVAELAPGAQRVGLENKSWFLTPLNYARLSELLHAEAVPVDDVVASLRLIKSGLEIEAIRKAADITNKAVRAAALAAVPGVRERDVAAVAFATLIREGSEYLGMEPFVASGPRAGNIHASFTDRVIRPGEGVLLEMASSYHRYHAPLMHTVWNGELSAGLAKMAEACLAAREAAVALVRPGNTPAQAHAACREKIGEYGLLHTYRKRTGYSVGIAFAPDWGEGHVLSLQETENRPFQPGMVIHVVPTLREESVAGFGFSAQVLVTDGDPEILTHCDIVHPES